MTNTIKFSDKTRALLDEAGFAHRSDIGAVCDVADWLADAIADNHRGQNSGKTAAEDWAEWGGIGEVASIYSDGPYGEGKWDNIWEQDFMSAVGDELDARMEVYIAEDFKQRITDADDLEELRDLLNACDKWSDGNGRDRGEIYTSNALPTFGGAEIQDTQNIYSWDENNVLTYREEFVIDARDEEEAAA